MKRIATTSEDNSMAKPAPTTEQLRRDIDAGRAGSKVKAPDPAAAPLGTDDEAAGTPASPEAVLAARQQEVESSPVRTEGEDEGLDAGSYAYASIIATVFAVLVAIAIWFAFSR
jgi:cobalamin biosynthesis Mg chelatase CobN